VTLSHVSPLRWRIDVFNQQQKDAYDNWVLRTPPEVELPTESELVDAKADEIYQDAEKVMQIIYDSGRDTEIGALLSDIAGAPATACRSKTISKLSSIVSSAVEHEARSRLMSAGDI